MLKAVGWIAGGIVGGLVLAQVISLFGDSEESSRGLLPAKSNTDSNVPVEQRFLALESQLAEEIEQRQRLENLLGEFLNGRWLGEEQVSDDLTVDDEVPSTNQQTVVTPEQRQQQFRERAQQRQSNQVERRTQRLEGAGFPPEQAAWILKREEEIRLDNLNAQWEQRRQNFLNSEDGQQANNPLREELGEENYERYLEATGRSTSVYVSQLLENSQATVAGLQSGDEIVRYNGERVYSFNDLNAANVQGALGESVMLDIVRDGVPMQISVERGPLGVIGGRRRGGGYRGR